ncbi:transglutaminase-like cysteine peptidase [Aurantimonas coralicida]|uniref:transglutaminase-like cysteine peptidase n=1 Tax=Aurantimonas coralicida TaxID=182270 RepID=UPI0035179F4F
MSTLKNIAKFCAVVALSATTLTGAQAAGIGGFARTLNNVEAVKRISMQRTTLAPFSYVLFCKKNPGDCRRSAKATIAWNSQSRRLLERVNRQVNRAIKPRNERSDVWNVGTASGDCEAFALTKRRALIRAGIPASSLLMAVARTRYGEGHAVLVARTTAGDFVLDNRGNALREWHRTDLSWLKIASAENPRIWYAMN